MNPILNPILLGLFAGVVTFTYLSWINNENNKRRKRKNKQKKIKPKKIDITIPIIVSISAWLITYLYHENCEKSGKESLSSISVDKNYSLNKNSESNTNTQRSYRMIKPGVNVPRNLQIGGDELPDVFINAI